MDQFISQPLTPLPNSADPLAMSHGEPGLPSRFLFSGAEHTVHHLLRSWKSSSRGLCGDNYLRRHWYEIQTTTGLRLTIYCDRQTRLAKKPKQRWWVYTIHEPTASATPRGPVVNEVNHLW